MAEMGKTPIFTTRYCSCYRTTQDSLSSDRLKNSTLMIYDTVLYPVNVGFVTSYNARFPYVLDFQALLYYEVPSQKYLDKFSKK